MIEGIYDNYFRRFRVKALKILPTEERTIFREYFDKWEKSLDWEAKAKVGQDFQTMSVQQFPMTVAFMLENFKFKMNHDNIELAKQADKELEDAEVGLPINSSGASGQCDSALPAGCDSGD